MKSTKDKIALLDAEILEEMLSELACTRLLIEEEIKPTAKALKNIDDKLTKTVENLDGVLAVRSIEMVEKLDIDFIHKEIVKQVLKKFNPSIRNVDELGILAKETEDLVQIFHTKYDDIENILNRYEKRIIHTKHFSRLIGTTFIVLSFGIGALFYPALLYFLR